MSKSTSKSKREITSFKEKTKIEGEKLVVEEFPVRILTIDKLLTSEKFDLKNLSICRQDVNIPVPEPKSKVCSVEKKPDNQATKSSTVDGANDNNKNRNEASQEKEDTKNAQQNTNLISKTESEKHFVDKKKRKPRCDMDKRIFLFPNGFEPVNKHISEMIDIVKPLMLQFNNEMRMLKLAIVLMVPKVEDGNNFGVEIQEQVIGSIDKADEIIISRYNEISRYFLRRGQLISQIAKYPHCEDFRRSLVEEDEKFTLILCLIVREIRDRYIRLHDLIIKNLDKIKNPRSTSRNTHLF